MTDDGGGPQARARGAGSALPEITVRGADERDLPALAALRRAWAQERGHIAPGADAGFEESFAAWWRVEQPRRSFWLAEVGDARVGVTAVGSLNVAEVVSMPVPGRRSERWGYVGNLVVLEDFRSRGVPRRLLAAAIGHARSRGYQRLVLRPSASGAAFYRAAGFRPVGDDMVVLDTVPRVDRGSGPPVRSTDVP